MKNYFSFIKFELPESRQLKVGDLVAITLGGGKTVEGKALEFNESFLALETFTGDKPMHESEDVQEFADGNSGYVIDYTVFPIEEITSLTKYFKLNPNKENAKKET